VVARRGRIGDWELDTVHGRGKACVVTVVERKTGLVRIGPIPRATKELTPDRTVKLLWAERQRVKTITADNGTEFHNYRELETILDTEVYFATPHHAWERGTNENTNGLIRQYLPKGTNLSRLTQRQCDRIAERLNNRPRLRLGFKTPNEAYYQPFCRTSNLKLNIKDVKSIIKPGKSKRSPIASAALAPDPARIAVFLRLAMSQHFRCE
jgi:IS30 family transposase